MQVWRWRKIPVITENWYAVDYLGFPVHSQSPGLGTHVLVLNSMKKKILKGILVCIYQTIYSVTYPKLCVHKNLEFYTETQEKYKNKVAKHEIS
jgi:hypothetical protein